MVCCPPSAHCSGRFSLAILDFWVFDFRMALPRTDFRTSKLEITICDLKFTAMRRQAQEIQPQAFYYHEARTSSNARAVLDAIRRRFTDRGSHYEYNREWVRTE